MTHHLPTSIYRLQLHKGFNLQAAIAALPYLKKLGIEAIYCSPYFEAYSQHGYDVTNPNKLNPHIGSRKDFALFFKELKRLELKNFIDVVPNHMGIKGGQNVWWQDVLEQGARSRFAHFFDIDWQACRGKLLLPILGAAYGECLKRGEIVLDYANEKFFFRYFDDILPLAKKSYPQKKNMRAINASKEKLHSLLEKQHYRLACWKVAGKEINYRRFFNFNDLAAMRMEDEKVLKAHHRLVFELAQKKMIDGIRIDHPDGLYDPKKYLSEVKRKTKLPVFLEKILDPHEKLPDEWPVEGTVGYDFLNKLTALFIDKRAEKAMTHTYEKFIGKHVDFGALLYEKKLFFAKTYMLSEIEQLGNLLKEVCDLDVRFRDLTRSDLTEGILEIIASFPVYRTYITLESKRISKRDAQYIQEAFERARKRNKVVPEEVFSFLEQLLLLRLQVEFRHSKQFRHVILRFQQFTAPIMARGLEDICFYLYNRFLSLNEVGSDPRNFGLSVAEFHQFNEEKHHRWPNSILTTSTHDTKRSEDVRMRLNVLSELTYEWDRSVFDWEKINRPFKRRCFPGPNTEYLIYQMLIGLWPDKKLFANEWKAFKDRLWTNLLKSIKEAREETSWDSPNEKYERCVKHFLFAILDRKKNGAFFDSFLPFVEKVTRFGYLNSLSSLVCKLGSPGIVDIYQGNESWNFSWVDPDNRRDIDFKKLSQESQSLVSGKEVSIEELKLYLHIEGLHVRKKHPDLFLEGEYLPLKVEGESQDALIAYLRKKGNKAVVVLCLRFFAEEKNRDDCTFTLPISGKFQDVFSKQVFSLKKGKNYLKPLLQKYPFALLTNC